MSNLCNGLGSSSSRGTLRNRNRLDAQGSFPRRDASRMSAIDRSPASMAPNSNAMNAEVIYKWPELYLSDAMLSYDVFFPVEVQRTSIALLALVLSLRRNKLKSIGATRDHLLPEAERSKLLKFNASSTIPF
ncbi:La protein 7 [Echinococcus multilocularis]|uniref:La protein 7 n=1 Tax=Echinococcus multilocularis TaxID=6211 RepID=A0A0S4MNE5_ECHMU|nr:La protein 7 [Echinococcus multilocularis]